MGETKEATFVENDTDPNGKKFAVYRIDGVEYLPRGVILERVKAKNKKAKKNNSDELDI